MYPFFWVEDWVSLDTTQSSVGIDFFEEIILVYIKITYVNLNISRKEMACVWVSFGAFLVEVLNYIRYAYKKMPSIH